MLLKIMSILHDWDPFHHLQTLIILFLKKILKSIDMQRFIIEFVREAQVDDCISICAQAFMVCEKQEKNN